MTCTQCKTSYPSYDLRDGLCISCIHKNLNQVQADAARVRQSLETSSRVENVGGYVYLASPYTSIYPDTEDLRALLAAQAVAWMSSPGGWITFSPIVHCHQIRKVRDCAGNFDYWNQFDKVFLVRAAAFCVFQINGWSTSKGVKQEYELALGWSIPVWTLSSDFKLDEHPQALEFTI